MIQIIIRPTKTKIICFYTQHFHAPPPSSQMMLMEVYHATNTAKALDTMQDKLCLIRTGVDAGNTKVAAKAILWMVTTIVTTGK